MSIPVSSSNPISIAARAFLCVSLAAGFAGSVVAGSPPAQESSEKPTVLRLRSKAVQDARDAVRPKVDPALQQLMKMSEPGAEHKALEMLVGTWSANGRVFAEPGTDPWPLKGTMVNSFILGGRYLQSEWQGQMQRQKFWGRGLDGYDNVKKVHFSQWIDSMNTGISLAEGESSKDGRIRTLYAEILDPQSGQMVKQKSITRVRGYNSYSLESSLVDGDGKETKTMEILFTREAGAGEAKRREGGN